MLERGSVTSIKASFDPSDEFGEDYKPCGMKGGGWKSQNKQLCVPRIIRQQGHVRKVDGAHKLASEYMR